MTSLVFRCDRCGQDIRLVDHNVQCDSKCAGGEILRLRAEVERLRAEVERLRAENLQLTRDLEGQARASNSVERLTRERDSLQGRLTRRAHDDQARGLP